MIIFSSTLLSTLIGICVLWMYTDQRFHHLFTGTDPKLNNRLYVQNDTVYALDETAVNHHGVVCTSKECVLIAGFLASNLNDKVDPCNDFYEYACGNYGLDRYLSANKPLRHTLTDMQSRLNKQVKVLLESSI